MLSKTSKRTYQRKKKAEKESSSAKDKAQSAKLKIYESLLNRLSKGESLKPTELKTLRALENELKISENDVCTTLREAGEYCGVSAKTISNNIKSGKIPRDENGIIFKSDLDEYKKTVHKHSGNGKNGNKNESLNLVSDKNKAEIDLKRVRIEKESLITGQIKGKLIPVTEVERIFTERVYELARALLILSRKISHRVAVKSEKKMKEVEKVIDEEVKELLKTYSRDIEITYDLINK